MKYSELVKILKKDGWQLDHHGANHDAYTHPKKPGPIMIGRHKAEEVAKGTLNAILKQAGLK